MLVLNTYGEISMKEYVCRVAGGEDSENFGPIWSWRHIQEGPFTVFAEPNNTGKTLAGVDVVSQYLFPRTRIMHM